MITDEIIESYLNCKYKAFRKINEEFGNKTEFELLQMNQLESNKKEFHNNPIEEYGENKIFKGYNFKKRGRIPKVKYLIQPTLNTEKFQISFDALEILSKESSSSKKLLIPILISPKEKITKIEK